MSSAGGGDGCAAACLLSVCVGGGLLGIHTEQEASSLAVKMSCDETVRM